jgi:hypothetical protein
MLPQGLQQGRVAVAVPTPAAIAAAMSLVGEETVRIPFQQGDVPLHRLPELGIGRAADAAVVKVPYFEIDALCRQVAVEGSEVLDGVGMEEEVFQGGD